MPHTYVVECFWPDVTESALAEAVARAEVVVRNVRPDGHVIRFIDTMLMPDDEVVFFRFLASSSHDVELASTIAELPFERVFEYFGTPTPCDEPTP